MPTRFILYVVRTSPTPDRCEGSVPWRVDSEEIFFGPCKKRLRRALRERFLGPERHLADVTHRERILIAGINAGQGPRPRKIVWAGDLLAVMSFAEAAARLTGPRYAKMRAAEWTPLHLEPILECGRLVGYRHHGLEHAEENAWWDDLVPPNMRRGRISQATATTLRLASDVEWWEAVPLDACMLLRNRFWADGAGLPFDDDSIRMLRAAQPNADQVDASAPFGRDSRGNAIGKRGSYLELEGSVAADLAAWIDLRTGSTGPERPPPGSNDGRRRRRC